MQALLTQAFQQNEQSEMWLGEWMSLRNNRDSLVISTKYGSPYKIYDPKKFGCMSNWGGGGTKSLKFSLKESLEKLQTTYVDILYLHWWDYATTIPELMQSLNDLVVSGKVHYLGISDTPAWVVSKVSLTHPYLPVTITKAKVDTGKPIRERSRPPTVCCLPRDVERFYS